MTADKTKSDKKQYVRLRDDVYRATNYMLAEQGTRISGIPGVKMTRGAYVNELVMNDLAARGHYPPKDKEPDMETKMGQPTTELAQESGGAISQPF